jgi:hypothetical protein
LVRRDELASVEVTEVVGCAVTGPLRTAYDLARRLPLVEAVVAVDALAFAQGIVPADMLLMARRRLGSRGTAQLPEVVALSNAFAESPMGPGSGWRCTSPVCRRRCCSTRWARTGSTWRIRS